MHRLNKIDPEVAGLIRAERENQENTISLIASENYVSSGIIEAQASAFNNRTIQGSFARRYFPGCQNVDKLENLAVQRVKKLFGAEHANVQPHSGSQANMIVYQAILKPGDTILGMSLSHGGHLSHGVSVNFSGTVYHAVHYSLNRKTETFDFGQILRLARKHKPRLIIAGGSAYPRAIDFRKFREIADTVDALLLADIAHIAGLVAAKVHPDPVPFCDFVTTSTYKTLRGPRGGIVMCKGKFAERIDKAAFPGIQGSIHMQLVAAKAVALKQASTREFRDYQKKIVRNSKALAARLKEIGFRLVTGGTDTHLMLVDLTNKKITGKGAEKALEAVGILANRNMIPFDTKGSFITSGIRLGTSTVTTRGFKEKEMETIGDLIEETLDNIHAEKSLEYIRGKVSELCQRYPLFKGNS